MRKWIGTVVILLIITAIGILLIRATGKSAYENGEILLEQQIPVATELFFQNKDTLDAIITSASDVPDFTCYYKDSAIIPQGDDIVPEDTLMLAEQLFNVGIFKVSGNTITKHEGTVTIDVLFETVHGDLFITGASFSRISYVWSEEWDTDLPESGNFSYSALDENWFLVASNVGAT
jgi:hypothetical protein